MAGFNGGKIDVYKLAVKHGFIPRGTVPSGPDTRQGFKLLNEARSAFDRLETTDNLMGDIKTIIGNLAILDAGMSGMDREGALSRDEVTAEFLRRISANPARNNPLIPQMHEDMAVNGPERHALQPPAAKLPARRL